MTAAGLHLDDLAVGDAFRSARRTVTEADIASFAAITGDYSPRHADEIHAGEAAGIRGRTAHEWLLVSIQSGLRSDLDRWRILAYLGMHRDFLAPVYPGDTVWAEYRIDRIRESRSKPDRGVVELGCELLNQDGEPVCRGAETFMVERRGGR